MAHTITHDPAPTPPTADPRSRPAHTRGVVVGWLLMAAGVAAAGVLLLVSTTAGPSQQPAPTPAPNGSLVDVPRNPDIAERWLAHHSEALGADSAVPTSGRYPGWPAGVPQSADAAERWFAQQHPGPVGWPGGIHRSADTADRWFSHQE